MESSKSGAVVGLASPVAATVFSVVRLTGGFAGRSIRYLGAAWGRDEAAGRVERQSRGTMATERAEQRPGADLALIVTIFEAGEPGEV
jgi:hypothetical protein